ncbi:hypothetical protein LG311_10350 [Sutcliffiella horikoshii]|uniref:hypothetical protein n=1 Tax=Sutcliffiella horikoshii TaxID=79883 RepID=UPI00384B2AA8
MNFSFNVQEAIFTTLVTEACMNNDLTNEHYLIESDSGTRKYVAVPTLVSLNRDVESEYKVVCKFDAKMLERYHLEAGKDELSKPWLESSIYQIIYGKPVLSKEKYKEILLRGK